MARDLNKVQMTGRLGADPEMRYTPQGHAVTTFRAASNRSWRTSEGEAHEDTEWFRVVAWNKLAEICNQWLSKGSRVYVEGRMQTRQWQDQEGQTRSQTEIIAIDIIILDTRRDNTPAQLEDTSIVNDDTPAPAPARPQSPSRTRATSVAAPAHTTKVARFPRGKDAFEEEDLPF
ncbi:MAG: single-stranded DNA-binding protein [Roseiflexaceae bacterium]